MPRALLLLVLLLPACGEDPTNLSDAGRLTVHVTAPTLAGAPGLYPLGLGSRRDGVVFVPNGYRSGTPAPLILMLHGSGASGRDALYVLQDAATRYGAIVLLPDSRGTTWDAIRGWFGPDVRFIDQALAWVFSRYDVDPGRMLVAGFSDGASYALSLALIDGDTFGGGAAFSPCRARAPSVHGSSPIFVSHGRQDAVLPIDACSRRLVPRLEARGRAVDYVEFDGGHEVPSGMGARALEYLWGPPPG